MSRNQSAQLAGVAVVLALGVWVMSLHLPESELDYGIGSLMLVGVVFFVALEGWGLFTGKSSVFSRVRSRSALVILMIAQPIFLTIAAILIIRAGASQSLRPTWAFYLALVLCNLCNIAVQWTNARDGKIPAVWGAERVRKPRPRPSTSSG